MGYSVGGFAGMGYDGGGFSVPTRSMGTSPGHVNAFHYGGKKEEGKGRKGRVVVVILLLVCVLFCVRYWKGGCKRVWNGVDEAFLIAGPKQNFTEGILWCLVC